MSDSEQPAMRDGWKRTTLGEAVEITMGRQRSPKHASGADMVVYLRAANVKDGRLELDDVLEMNFTPEEQAKYALADGDVLVTEGCGSIAQLGASGAWSDDLPGTVCFQNTLLRLRARPGVSLPGFVEVWARHAHRSGLWAAISSGTNIFHIGSRRAEVAPMLLPPLHEQERIVDLVQQLARVQLAMEAHAAEARRCAVAVRTDCFDAAGVATVPLSDLCDRGGIQIGPFGSQLHASDYVDEGVPTVMPKDIIDGRIVEEGISRVAEADWRRLSKHHLRPGDIVLPRRGELAKRALVTEEQTGWLCGTGSVRVRLRSDVDGEVVFQALSTASTDRWLADNAVGITMPNLNTEIVGRIPVPMPQAAQAAAALVRSLDELAGEGERAVGAAHLALASVVGALLSGDHEIPDSYDQLIREAS
jgi:type I restriction enzyme, S subunit